ncbi:S-layer homology domain-containing protein [Virgibacillus halodenitrificans]|uniref:S-layer homology domain-containing protein n=1 Tax=Virgibacillus halodenitrificans TaxID=1482 RepID=UPI001F2AD71B|nr:S-layer homology domain-containing protein [Virgibacillus halodenitrificans]MCG1027033.1 S-layer homology domain-containing protein [Virgibacillus halodenitrificans]
MVKVKKKKMRTYSAAAITAAMAASSVAYAPFVAEAQTTEFSDVNPEKIPVKGMRDAVYEMVEQGAIVGYPDGTFRPHNPIYRGQMATILTKALDLPVPEDIGQVNNQYTDAESFGENAKFVAAATKAGIFKGNSNNEFGYWDTVTREQFASVLYNYMTSLDIQPTEKTYINLKNVSPTHRPSVQYISDMDLTSQRENYRAYEDVSRIQFATFFVLAQDTIKAAQAGVTDEVRKSINEANSKEEVNQILIQLPAFDDLNEADRNVIIDALWGIIDGGGSFDSNEELNNIIQDPSDAENRYAAHQVTEEINKLSFEVASNPSNAEIEAVENARASYEALTTEQQQYVEEETLNSLKAAEDIVDQATNSGDENKAKNLVEQAEETLNQADYEKAKAAVEKLPAGNVKNDLTQRLEKVQQAITSEGPEASFQKKTATLYTEPVVTTLPDRQKTSGGLVGLNLGILDLGVLSGNQISALADNENNKFDFTVEPGNERDVKVSVAIHTILGGKAFTLNVYERTGEDELTRIDQKKGSGGGALGITAPKEYELGTFDEGEYTVFLGLEEGLTVVEAVPFKMYDIVNRDYTQISTEESVVTGNLLNNQQLGAKNEAIISEVKPTGQEEAEKDMGDSKTKIMGESGELYISQDGSYRYVPDNSQEVVGETEVFDYEIKNTYNNKASTNELHIDLVEAQNSEE